MRNYVLARRKAEHSLRKLYVYGGVAGKASAVWHNIISFVFCTWDTSDLVDSWGLSSTLENNKNYVKLHYPKKTPIANKTVNAIEKITRTRNELCNFWMYLMLLLLLSLSPGDWVEFLCWINRWFLAMIETLSIDSPPSDSRLDVLLCFNHIEYELQSLMSEYVSERLPSVILADPRLAILSGWGGWKIYKSLVSWGLKGKRDC